jgi:hypothetical protein
MFYILFLFAIITNKIAYGFRNKIAPNKIHIIRHYMNVISMSNEITNKSNINIDEETDFANLLRLYRNNSGFDERYKGIETIDNEMFLRIKINLIKFALLKQLESHQIGEPVKLDLIHENRYLFDSPTYAINITAGGLYKDWDFS